MFAEWVAVGAAIGVKAFFAVFTFGLMALLVLSFVAALSRAFRRDE